MTTRSGLPAALIVFGLCIPLAVFIGFQLATPTSFGSYSLIFLILATISLPLLLKWHHFLLVACWNAFVVVFFLPGQPSLGVTMAFISLLMSIFTQTLLHERESIRVPQVSIPVFSVVLIVLFTAWFTGGVHGRALGSDIWGGRRYLGLVGASIGYFALTAYRVPQNRAWLYSILFFLSGTTALVSDLAYAAGPKFSFLFAFFQSEVAFQQAFTQDTLMRLTGLSWAAMAVLQFMLLKYGFSGIFDLRKFWRLPLFGLLIALTMFGGFRSMVILLVLLCFLQFYYEGLIRTKLFPILLFLFTFGFIFIAVFAERLPLSVQRSISFLPIEVHPMAKQDAVSTLDWRLQMWKVVLPDVPQYLLVGKGFSFSGTDFQLTQEAVRKGSLASFEDTLVSGNYHNGLLTIIIPFGIWGLIAFICFCYGGLKVLYANYRYSSPEIKQINTFLLANFMARLIFYLVFYGQFDLDFVVFTGLVGLSIALNHGVRSAESYLTDQTRIRGQAELKPAIALPQ